MAEYANGKNVLLRPERPERPEPGRPVNPSEPQKIIVEKEVDVASIADAVVKAIGNRIHFNQNQSNVDADIGFDDSKTLERLAETMSVQNDNNESNFDDLGNIKKTQKDQKETQKTIDLLSNLDD
jgi:hypothetical protein